MTRKVLLLLLAGVLAFVATGCGSKTVEAKIADERIVGEWTSAEGGVAFYADGSATIEQAQGGVNSVSDRFQFEMPEKDKLIMHFPEGDRYYKVTLKGKGAKKTQSVVETDDSGKPVGDGKAVLYRYVGE